MVAGGFGNVYEGAEVVMEVWRWRCWVSTGGDDAQKGDTQERGEGVLCGLVYKVTNCIDETYGGRTSKRCR